jgi:TolB-like protein/Tfp pilus assembly protein PilF
VLEIHTGLEDPQTGIVGSLSAEEVKVELGRILSSRTFQTAERQREFLRYAVEQKLDGHAERIKEYSIATAVFHRADSFDPRLDPIVRIEARKLRIRLAKYYATEGEHDPIRVEFPKGGYAPVFRHGLVAAKTAPASNAGSGPDADRPSPSWKSVAVVVGVLLIVAGAIYWLGMDRRTTTVSGHVTSIAVLPFLNLGESREDDYFSDGLTEELIELLGRVPGLHVVARTSSFQFRGKTLDVREIGQKLNARTILEGSVRKYGGRLRINAQLADTSNGYRLWSRSYDRELKDALAIQREISQDIVSALEGQLDGARNAPHPPAASLDGKVAIKPEAHEAYLKGLYFWSKSTAESNQTAQNYLEQAIALEPGYAPAYTALARCYITLPYSTSISNRAMISKIEAAAQQALRLDASLAEAHVDLAVAAAYDYAWPAAEREFRKALELDPNNAVTRRLYNENYLVKVGRLEDSLSQTREALKLEPVSVYLTQTVGRSLYYLRRYDEAIDQFRKAEALDANFGMTSRGLGLVYLQQKKYAEGLRELETARRLLSSDPWIAGLLGYAYGVSGEPAKARAILDEFLQQSQRGRFPAVVIAQVYIGLGEKDRAFEWLKKAVEEGDAHVLLRAEPLYDLLRPDPRFAELLEQMKLPAS